MSADPFAPPTASLEPETSVQQPWFAVGTSKLVLMVVLSFGLYSIHWFERHYRFQKRLHDQDTWPLARGFFSIFFVSDLAGRVRSAAEAARVDVPWSDKSVAAL